MGITWSITPDDIIAGIEEDVTDHLKKVAESVFDNLEALSPVDTGKYRNNHIVSLNAPDYTWTEGTTGNNAREIINSIQFGLTTVVYLQNNLPYSERIENGWSKYAPQGVYQLARESTIAEFS